MENTAEPTQIDSKLRKKCGFGRCCTAFIRWGFILLFAVILLGGLYFKAPPKVLVLDGLLLALLTVVPKKKRKYGWLTLAAAVLAITVWIFIPEKDTGDWKPYTFDEELAALEAERIVPLEDDAAPLYEALLEQWKVIEENDPPPLETDNKYLTMERPWTAEEFPEIAEWFDRHDDFFQDLVAATQKPSCYFPANVTVLGLSESLERLSPLKRLVQHLKRMSYLDVGESNNITDALKKQIAICNLGKHINQQPLMIETLVGVAVEAIAYDAWKEMLMLDSFSGDMTTSDHMAMVENIRNSHFDHREKWEQTLAYEKLFHKYFLGMLYEVDPGGKVRYSRGKSKIDLMNQSMGLEDTVNYTYWDGVRGRFFVITFWLGGLPKDPMKASSMIDEEWDAQRDELGKTITKAPQIDELFDDLVQTGFQFNYRKFVSASIQMAFIGFEKIQNEIFPKVRTKKEGLEIVCELVLYKKQHECYPNSIEKLRSSNKEKQDASQLYDGFVYEKTDDSFKLYHVGQNGIDENGHYQRPEYDPNDLDFEKLMNRTPEPDDILIWPEELEDGD